MLVGKIIYFTFSFLMILIEIFWFTQRLSQLKAVNYIMGFLGLMDSILTVFMLFDKNFTPSIISIVTEPLFTITVGVCTMILWRTKK